MRWPEPSDFPEWLFFEAMYPWVAIPLLLVALTLLVYGMALTRQAIADRSGSFWVLDSYDFWLGQFFLGDAVFYAILCISILRDSTVDYWVVGLFTLIAVPAVMAFRLWLRGRA
jgi:uncharacterized membrane protein